jgi:hypothetical protein
MKSVSQSFSQLVSQSGHDSRTLLKFTYGRRIKAAGRTLLLCFTVEHASRTVFLDSSCAE